jgi:hypothetical protein
MRLRGWLVLSIASLPAVGFGLACSSSSDSDDSIIPYDAGPDVVFVRDTGVSGSDGSTDAETTGDAGTCTFNPGSYQVHNEVEDGSTPGDCITPTDGGTKVFPEEDSGSGGTCTGPVSTSTTQGPEGCTYSYLCTGASGSTGYSLTVAPDGNSGAFSLSIMGQQLDGGPIVCNFLETYTRE